MLRLLVLSVILSAEVSRVGLFEDTAPRPVVHTEEGSIRGLRSQDGDYNMFRGIPYALVNKSNVFGAAIPHPKFEGVFNAYTDSTMCPQVEFVNRTLAGSLECLHLNVYAPDCAGADSRLPVIVFIHGGVHIFGSASYFGPKFIVRHNVILVTVNYRLGPYGFMCLGIPEAIGNQGLKDQVIALRWIKKNIAAFGGDDTKITIHGHSSGAQSVGFHLHFRNENLFSKAILQSGHVEQANVTMEPDLRAPFRLAERLNYKTKDLKDALAYLNAAHPYDVVAAAHDMNLFLKPCVEKLIDAVDNYVTEHPINVGPEVKDIDILTGFTDEEMYKVFLYKQFMNNWPPNFYVENIINTFFDFKDNDQHFAAMKDIVTQFYFDNMKNSTELELQVGNLLADFGTNHGTLRSINKYIENDVKNLYLYMFSYNGKRNYAKVKKQLVGGGARHGDDLGYLFDISHMKIPMNQRDKLIVDRMTELWTNFAKYGNPTPKLTELINVHWPRLTRDSWQYLELNTEVRVASRPHRSRMAFVDLFFFVNKQYRRGYKKA